MARADCMYMTDHSAMTLVGAQIGLFAGSLFSLGTERHRPIFREGLSLRLPGCFALTELGHGSNVKV